LADNTLFYTKHQIVKVPEIENSKKNQKNIDVVYHHIKTTNIAPRAIMQETKDELSFDALPVNTEVEVGDAVGNAVETLEDGS